MRILFMGTSEFAIPVLEALHKSSARGQASSVHRWPAHQIVQVYTAPPAEAGRGHKLQKSPLHLAAEALGLAVACPKSLKKPEAVEAIKALNVDVIVVASYGKILAEPVLTACKRGCINVHPSALPRWRGAAPIERTILAGDESTAVCIMQMDAGIDTGDILLEQAVPVPSGITAPELRDQLAKLGGELLIKVLDNIDTIAPKPQANEGATYATKLVKEEGLINWSTQSAEQIERMTRAFTPWPGCFFNYNGERIRILKAEVVLHDSSPTRELELASSSAPGTVMDNQLSIRCSEQGSGSLLRPLTLQRPGKKPVALKDFLNGCRIARGTVLS